MITWNNVTSDSLGIFVEAAPFYVKPKRKVDVYSVPGRSGDIIRPQDAWDNVDQDYEIFAGDGSEHAVPGAFPVISCPAQTRLRAARGGIPRWRWDYPEGNKGGW